MIDKENKRQDICCTFHVYIFFCVLQDNHYTMCENHTHNIYFLSSMLNLLTQLGFTSTQSEIFLYLYQYGPKPASSVAKKIGSERTNTYKIIETMMRHGLVAETNIQNTKQFYIPDKQVLRHQLEHQKQLIQTQETVLLDIEQ